MTKTITPHNPTWKAQFAAESCQLQAVLEGNAVSVLHIGSTAIASILAKPIIDILAVVRSLSEVDETTHSLIGLGYEAKGAYGIEGRRYFRKSNAEGIRTYHVHIYENGSPHIERHIAFRDYLRAYPEKAAEYSALKKVLVDEQGKVGIDYQNGKEKFVKMTEQEALKWYQSKK